MVSHECAAGRVRDLRDWAEYILASLSQDQEWEQGNVEMIGHLVGREALEKAREETRRLSAVLNDLLSRTESKVAGVS